MSEIIYLMNRYLLLDIQKMELFGLMGGPGSGKTLVAVKRAIFLAKDYKYAEKDDKVLFLFIIKV